MIEVTRVNDKFEATVYDIFLQNDEIRRSVKDEVKGLNLLEMTAFLEFNGVPQNEASFGIEELRVKGDMYASFGVRGGFVCTHNGGGRS